MDAPLLRTKHAIPPVRPDLVPRPHLIAQLSVGLARKLILVSAPAGSGKTTLVSTWLAECRGRIAWLSLDESDNDPVRFLRYVIAALQSALPDLGKAVRDLSLSPSPPSLTHSLTVLINEIAALHSQDSAPLFLVLDDYHTIKANAIHDGLAFLLDHMPETVHLVLVTRADPPLPLSRLRARHQLLEIRMGDLRFVHAEAAAFLNQVMGLRLSVDEITALLERTEGWVVGLQMAALALQSTELQPKGQDTADFVQTFPDSDRYILDYLVEEVLEHQPDDVQTFLLRTAILDQLTGPLCDVVRGQGSGGQSGREMLEWLERANLFVVPLDSQRAWYRYHHLFASLLRQRLSRTEPALVPELHRRAGQWYERNGFVEEAIEHALSGDDLERAAHLLEQAAEPLLMRGELATLMTWLGALPDEIVRRHPLLCLYTAGALLLNGEPPSVVQEYLQIAARHGIADSVTHGTVALRALLALWQGDIDQSVNLGQQALASLPAGNAFWRGIVAGNLGIAYMVNSIDLDLASRTLEEATQLSEKAGNVMGAVIALCNLAEVRTVRAQLWAAKRLYDRALDLAVDDRGRRLPIGGMAAIGTASLLQEWNELDAAEGMLTTALDRASENLPIWAVDGYLALARLRQTQGDDQAAQDAIAEARAVAARTSATELDDWIVAATQARIWVAQDRLDAAEGWAKSRGLIERPDASRGSVPYSVYELEHLVLAELWIAQGDAGRALDLLRDLLSRSSALQRTDSVIKILILTARAHDELGHTDRALTALAQALAPARPSGYVRAFLDHGTPMLRLLRQSLAQGIAGDDAGRLLAAAGSVMAPPTVPQALVEPLSDRELQVLRLLATHLTGAEIGKELYISVNTVRFHLKNIYAKLSVHSRSDAVERARELGVL
jgi:LuxR family maltose regulon positive regulatory protein